jgi:hypothetical protein
MAASDLSLKGNFTRFAAMLCTMFPVAPLNQCFSNGGICTTGGMQRVMWWYVKLFGNYNFFHNSILNMLITLLKLFKCI